MDPRSLTVNCLSSRSCQGFPVARWFAICVISIALAACGQPTIEDTDVGPIDIGQQGDTDTVVTDVKADGGGGGGGDE